MKKAKAKSIKKAQDKLDRRLIRLEAKVVDFVNKCYEGEGTKKWRVSADKLADGVIHYLSKCMTSVHSLPKMDTVDSDQHYPNWPMPNTPANCIPEEKVERASK